MKTIEKIKAEKNGFVMDDEIDQIVHENRLHPCLVRCGGGRFTAPAQDVAHFIAIIERDGHDYVRDVFLQ